MLTIPEENLAIFLEALYIGHSLLKKTVLGAVVF